MKFKVLLIVLSFTVIVLLVVPSKSGESSEVGDSRGESAVFDFLFEDLLGEKSLEIVGSQESLNNLRTLRNRNALIWKLREDEAPETLSFRVLSNDESEVLLVYEGELLIEVVQTRHLDGILESVEEKYWYYEWNEEFEEKLERLATLGESR